MVESLFGNTYRNLLDARRAGRPQVSSGVRLTSGYLVSSMRLQSTLLSVALAMATPALAPAQGGRLDDRTEYTVITGTGTGNHHGPLQAVVLWRGEPGWLDGNGPERRWADSVYRYARRDAEDRHLSFFGSGFAYGLLSDDHRQLTVEGHTFDIGRTDSALVVMVAVPAFGLARMVTTTRLSPNAVPEAFWPKTWQSGDTSFFVHPQYPRDVAMLRQALTTSPVILDYLR